tara:strand:+ start:11544 stop:11777 length:234 start_codon:yes stop_codon:yes gene_type:complete
MVTEILKGSVNTSIESWESLSVSDDKLQYILEELREIKSLLHDEVLMDRIIRRREEQKSQWTESIRGTNGTTDKESS